MYVSSKMITALVTVAPDAEIMDAYELMVNNRLYMLPVVDQGKLIGYLRKEDVQTALPSPATMLSKHELPDVMSRVIVKDFILKDLETITPETEIEEAAELMVKKDLPGLAVVNKNGILVGYINRSIMLQVLVEEMGLHRQGIRFAIEFKDKPGVMSEVALMLNEMGMNLVSVASFFRGDICILEFKVQTDDISPITDELEKRGYKIIKYDKTV